MILSSIVSLLLFFLILSTVGDNSSSICLPYPFTQADLFGDSKGIVTSVHILKPCSVSSCMNATALSNTINPY